MGIQHCSNVFDLEKTLGNPPRKEASPYCENEIELPKVGQIIRRGTYNPWKRIILSYEFKLKFSSLDGRQTVCSQANGEYNLCEISNLSNDLGISFIQRDRILEFVYGTLKSQVYKYILQ